MSLVTKDSPTHDAPRITKSRFIDLLKTKNSPMVPEAGAVYDILVGRGIEPAFALAQFRVESQYGTAGYAKVTGSIGNMLYDANLTIHAVGKYAPGNGYTYAKYNNYLDAARDYATYLDWYRDRYSLASIYAATARWIGKPQGSSGHLSYVGIILQDIIEYQYPPGTFFQAGDRMIYSEGSFDKTTGRLNRKYPVVKDVTRLYAGTTEDSFLKVFRGTSSNAWYLGPVQGNIAWGSVLIGTSLADEDGTWLFIKNIDPKKIVKV